MLVILKRTLLLTTGILALVLEGKAQDIQFSQYYAVTPFVNPAYAGSTHDFRAMAHQRIQWPGLAANYVTTYVGGDYFFHNYNSGVGAYFVRDWQGGSTVTTTEVHTQYSYELPLSSSIVVRAGLDAGFAFRHVNYAELTFPSQYNSTNNQYDLTGSTDFGKERKLFPDISSGALLYTDNLWVGLSAHHMNTPNQGLYDNVGKLPMRTTLIAGYKIHLHHGKHMAYLHDAPDISITPTINYKMQGKSDQLDFGVYGFYNQFMMGAWYRGIPVKHYEPGLNNRESLVLLGGYRYNDFSFGLSYDFTVSKLTRAGTGGSYEINITYSHHKHRKHHKQMKRLPCPDFHHH